MSSLTEFISFTNYQMANMSLQDKSKIQKRKYTHYIYVENILLFPSHKLSHDFLFLLGQKKVISETGIWDFTTVSTNGMLSSCDTV